MKKIIKFLSIVILFLSTTLSAQRVYDITLNNNKLSIVETLKPKSDISIETIGEVQFELYDLESKVVLGVEKKSNITDKTLVKYMQMNNGDTKIDTRVKFNDDGRNVEYFYYNDCYMTNYFVSQYLQGTNYILEIRNNNKTLKYNIKNGKIILIK
jgi:hypothetical protein